MVASAETVPLLRDRKKNSKINLHQHEFKSYQPIALYNSYFALAKIFKASLSL